MRAGCYENHENALIFHHFGNEQQQNFVVCVFSPAIKNLQDEKTYFCVHHHQNDGKSMHFD